MRFPTIHQLEVFCRVVQLSSMARAAEELHVAPSSVSMQIHELEGRYGAQLLSRGVRRTTPTTAGRVLYERVRSLLDGLEAVSLELKVLSSGERGLLRFATSRTIGSAVVRPALQSYECAHPHVDISYHVMASSQQAKMEVLEERAEFALVGRVVPGGSVEVRPLLREPLVLAIAPTHPLAGLDRVALADLAAHTLLLREPPVLGHESVVAMLDRAGLTPNIREFGSTEALKAEAVGGAGIGVLPGTVVAEDVARGDLCTCTVEGFEPYRTVHVLSLPHTPLSPVAKSFLEMVRASCHQTRVAA
ncbi:MAG: LysR family transcriptional regulator [Micromonosporaceae bacterium]|nr:LysR family transcriptional regulator [Micromonosporaceae bacterium]